MLKATLYWIAGGLMVALVLAWAAYYRDMKSAHARVRGRSTVIPSPYGQIKYTAGGAGPPVLVIHGSGGGYDQGELIAQSFLDPGFRWIAPSRFGYLRSTFHPGATFDDQAHAYAALLDHLGVRQAAVVALSHGGPPALLFAALHPERVASLTLVSAGVAAAATDGQAQADEKGRALVSAFKHDWLYWGLTRLFRKPFMGRMGAGDGVIAGLTPGQRELVGRVMDQMLPTSPRLAGVMFDNGAALPGARAPAGSWPRARDQPAAHCGGPAWSPGTRARARPPTRPSTAARPVPPAGGRTGRSSSSFRPL